MPEGSVNMSLEEKQELIKAAKTLPQPEVFSLKPRNFEEAFRFSNLIAESDLIPKDFQKKPANVLVAVQLGMELGVSPMQALQNIYVINGRPAIFGDLLPAIVLGSGLLEGIDEKGDDKQASCTVKRKGFASITRTFSMAEAEKAGLTNRNPTYKAYPKRMLAMRARAYAFRDMFADVLKGVAIKEDIEDVEERDVTPAQQPIAMPKAAEQTVDQVVEVQQAMEPEPSSPPSRADIPAEPKKPTLSKLESALSWLDDADDAEIMDGTSLPVYLKGLNQREQLAVCRAYNERKKKIIAELKE